MESQIITTESLVSKLMDATYAYQKQVDKLKREYKAECNYVRDGMTITASNCDINGFNGEVKGVVLSSNCWINKGSFEFYMSFDIKVIETTPKTDMVPNCITVFSTNPTLRIVYKEE